MARALQTDARRMHGLVAWVVMWDAPGYPDRFVAQLPPDLERFGRQPVHPPEVTEIWFTK